MDNVECAMGDLECALEDLFYAANYSLRGAGCGVCLNDLQERCARLHADTSALLETLRREVEGD